ncbi:MAG: DUF427 domain-containing protein [Pseudonocardiaceae bacterium]|nr:DUF427 domain-containing protein [Pseudonocardiaceae bacterium]
MTLTFSTGPLAAEPAGRVNYRIEGPAHRLLFDEFPRRVRAMFGAEVVLDTQDGKLLHETAYLPQLYVPDSDVRAELLTPTDHRTHCPFKGDASYWSVQVGDRTAENAVWAYPTPHEDASWLRGYQAVYFGAMDAWFDEDEEVVGHLRDPYHRVDVRDSSRHVRVLVGGQVVAETDRPKILSETGLPNRYYLPPEDVHRGLLEPSATHTVCPYKGTASYHTLRTSGGRVTNAAWSYPQPLDNALKVAGHLCFHGADIEVGVDGESVA